jgi:hypothetical protein
MVAMPGKKEVSPRIIPLKHVREVDFVAPTMWRPGYLRIIMYASPASWVLFIRSLKVGGTIRKR